MTTLQEAPRPRPSPLPSRPAEPAPAPAPDREPRAVTGLALQRKGRVPAAPPTRIVLPVRYSAWLNGDIGTVLEARLRSSLAQFGPIAMTRLPRALLLEADEAEGPFLEGVHRAAVDMEEWVERTYPVFHHQMGPVWTGTLQCVFA